MSKDAGVDPEISKGGFTVKTESRASPNLGRVPLDGHFVNVKGCLLDFFALFYLEAMEIFQLAYNRWWWGGGSFAPKDTPTHLDPPLGLQEGLS